MDGQEIKDRLQRAIKLIRATWHPPSNPGLLQRQAISRRRRPSRLPLWISESTLPIHDDKVLRELFLKSVEISDDLTYAFESSNADVVRVEWNGFQRTEDHLLKANPDLAKEQYKALMQDTKNDLTILFIHGGGLGGPSTNRTIPLALSKLTGGRICQVDYRLAPQSPFPAALYDLLLAYLFLISPPDGAFHSPVSPSRIVLAGESSGGNLCLSLLQLLLQFKRSGIEELSLNGKFVPLRLPRGISVLSGYCDQSDCMPSHSGTANIDYSGGEIFYTTPAFPSDKIWPAHPPRYSAYCEGRSLCHPLVSPTNAKDWTGSPPMWLACGEESVLDSNKVIARRAARQGVGVIWEEYSGMPHVFPLLPGLEDVPPVKTCLRSWAQFLKSCCGDTTPSTHAVMIGVEGEVTSSVALADLLPEVPEDEVEHRMQASMCRLDEIFRRRQRRTSKL